MKGRQIFSHGNFVPLRLHPEHGYSSSYHTFFFSKFIDFFIPLHLKHLFCESQNIKSFLIDVFMEAKALSFITINELIRKLIAVLHKRGFISLNIQHNPTVVLKFSVMLKNINHISCNSKVSFTNYQL